MAARRLRTRPWLAVLSCFVASAAIVDRIAVTVGQQIITESEIITDLRVSAFLDRKPIDLSAASRRVDAGRLVDEILILQEAADSHFVLPSQADAVRQVEKEKAQYSSPADFQAALANYHITEADLTAHMLAGLRALAFTDLRFRPEVQISEKDLHAEYDKLVAQAGKANAVPAPSFDDSRDQLEQIITNDRVMQALDQWLNTTRQERNVVYREDAFK
jgi:hypothetical protein